MYNFYILAPENMFSLERKKYVTKAELRKEEDPIIFFKINDSYYRMIHKWGNDLSIFRRILGFTFKNARNHFFVNMAVYIIIISMIFSIVFPSYVLLYPIISIMAILLLSLIPSFYIRYTDEDDPIIYHYSEFNWNSHEKLKT